MDVRFSAIDHNGETKMYAFGAVEAVYAVPRSSTPDNPYAPRSRFAIGRTMSVEKLKGNGYELKNTVMDSRIATLQSSPLAELSHVIDDVYFFMRTDFNL